MLGATIGACDRAFFQLSLIGRIDRSVVLLSISMQPSSMKRVSPLQRVSA